MPRASYTAEMEGQAVSEGGQTVKVQND